MKKLLFNCSECDAPMVADITGVHSLEPTRIQVTIKETRCPTSWCGYIYSSVIIDNKEFSKEDKQDD